jgi:quercetin dioxygenase-like cupin family protein
VDVVEVGHRMRRGGVMKRPLWCFALVLVAAGARADEPYRRVEEVLSASETVVGERLRYPDGATPTVHAVVITLQPGERTARHRHGVPLFAYVLEGELTVDYAGHGQRFYRKGDALLEAMNVFHVGQNTGASPLRILAVYLGAAGRPETVSEMTHP